MKYLKNIQSRDAHRRSTLADVHIVRKDLLLPRDDILTYTYINRHYIQYSLVWCQKDIFMFNIFLSSVIYVTKRRWHLVLCRYISTVTMLKYAQMSQMNEHFSLAFLDEMQCSFLDFSCILCPYISNPMPLDIDRKGRLLHVQDRVQMDIQGQT